jgi:hypothetical protein
LLLNSHHFRFVVDYNLEIGGANKPFLPAKLFVCEVILGVTMALGIGALIIYSSFSTFDDDVTSKNYTVPSF